MSDLHARILAAIEHGEQTARASSGPEDQQWHTEPRWTGNDQLAYPWRISSDLGSVAKVTSVEHAEHIALHDPAAALRSYAEDRSALRRHHPCDGDCPRHTVPMSCHRCDLPAYRRGYGDLGCEWQLSMARRLGLQP